MILVTGCSGTVSTEVVKELSACGAAVRGGYRSRPPTMPGVQPAQIDMTTGAGLDAAMAGVEALFLLAGDMDEQTEAELRVVEAARRAGVRKVVKLSVLGAPDEAFTFARVHRQVERAIEASGMAYTFLRPGSFMQNFVTYYGDTIRLQSALFLPCGDAREAHVDARDIARVAARALTSDGHDGKAYNLLGPQPLSYAQAAATISAAVGRTIAYVSLTDAEFRKAMADTGVPESYVNRLADLYRYVREGGLPMTGGAIREVTGREPTTFDQFVRDHADAWRV